MRKFLSILLVLTILLSGLHLTVASHLCGGEIASVKWSVSGKKATCGMEDQKGTCPAQNELSSSCCQDRIASYLVDSNYYPSYFKNTKISESSTQFLLVPLGITGNRFNLITCTYIIRNPRDQLYISSVSLENICVFLI